MIIPIIITLICLAIGIAGFYYQRNFFQRNNANQRRIKTTYVQHKISPSTNSFNNSNRLINSSRLTASNALSPNISYSSSFQRSPSIDNISQQSFNRNNNLLRNSFQVNYVSPDSVYGYMPPKSNINSKNDKPKVTREFTVKLAPFPASSRVSNIKVEPNSSDNQDEGLIRRTTNNTSATVSVTGVNRTSSSSSYGTTNFARSSKRPMNFGDDAEYGDTIKKSKNIDDIIVEDFDEEDDNSNDAGMEYNISKRNNLLKRTTNILESENQFILPKKRVKNNEIFSSLSSTNSGYQNKRKYSPDITSGQDFHHNNKTKKRSHLEELELMTSQIENPSYNIFSSLTPATTSKSVTVIDDDDNSSKPIETISVSENDSQELESNSDDEDDEIEMNSETSLVEGEDVKVPQMEEEEERLYAIPPHIHSVKDHEYDKMKTKNRLKRFLDAVQMANSELNETEQATQQPQQQQNVLKIDNKLQEKSETATTSGPSVGFVLPNPIQLSSKLDTNNNNNKNVPLSSSTTTTSTITTTILTNEINIKPQTQSNVTTANTKFTLEITPPQTSVAVTPAPPSTTTISTSSNNDISTSFSITLPSKNSVTKETTTTNAVTVDETSKNKIETGNGDGSAQSQSITPATTTTTTTSFDNKLNASSIKFNFGQTPPSSLSTSLSFNAPTTATTNQLTIPKFTTTMVNNNQQSQLSSSLSTAINNNNNGLGINNPLITKENNSGNMVNFSLPNNKNSNTNLMTSSVSFNVPNNQNKIESLTSTAAPQITTTAAPTSTNSMFKLATTSGQSGQTTTTTLPSMFSFGQSSNIQTTTPSFGGSNQSTSTSSAGLFTFGGGSNAASNTFATTQTESNNQNSVGFNFGGNMKTSNNSNQSLFNFTGNSTPTGTTTTGVTETKNENKLQFSFQATPSVSKIFQFTPTNVINNNLPGTTTTAGSTAPSMFNFTSTTTNTNTPINNQQKPNVGFDFSKSALSTTINNNNNATSGGFNFTNAAVSSTPSFNFMATSNNNNNNGSLFKFGK